MIIRINDEQKCLKVKGTATYLLSIFLLHYVNIMIITAHPLLYTNNSTYKQFSPAFLLALVNHTAIPS